MAGLLSGERLDLGSGHWLEMAQWNPDLELNPQHAHLASQLPATVSAIVYHTRRPDDDACAWRESLCSGSITFDVPMAHKAGMTGPYWTVESWEPLTLSPSLLCHCSDHGFVREGRWVSA